MDKVKEILTELEKVNARVFVKEGSLVIDAAKGVINERLKTLIRAHKEDLIDQVTRAREYRYESIPKVPQHPWYPMSSAQHRIWVLSQFRDANITYNIPGIYVFEGRVDENALSKAFEKLIVRHESLRTSLRPDESGTVRQFILPSAEVKFSLRVDDLSKDSDQEESIKAIVQEDLTAPFDLSAGPLLRAGLYRLTGSRWLFTYTMHHIISDGWSMAVLFRELMILYNSLTAGRSIEDALPKLLIQYKDYTAWQLDRLSGDRLREHRDYWLKQLAAPLPLLELPADRSRPPVKTYNGGHVATTISAGKTVAMKRFCGEHDATLFMGLLAAVNALLNRYTVQEDIILGTPVAGRDHADLEGQVGLYVNTLALRCRFSGTNSFTELLKQVRQVTLDSYEHQMYPFDEVVACLDLQRDVSRNPLFDVMVVLQSSGEAHREAKLPGGLEVSAFKTEHLFSKFDLTFGFAEINGKIEVSIEYNSDLYNRSTVERMALHLEQIAGSVVAHPAAPVGSLDYLNAGEKHQLLVEFNDTDADFPKDKTIIDLFEEQVRRTPGGTAVVFEDYSLTYRELNEQSNKLAHYLRKNYTVQPDDLIAVLLPRSEWMIVALLAVIKSGGAYVSIDPDYPRDRISFMIEDSGCKLVIDKEELKRFEEQQHEFPVSDPEHIIEPSHLAYVIYTSGTTGRPKGTLIEHRNVVRLMKNDRALFDFTANDVWTLFHSFCFDFSVWEMYGALLFGGKLVVVPLLVTKDPGLFVDLLAQHKVTVLNQTPSSFYNVLSAELKKPAADLNIRYVIFGGEALSPSRLKEWKERYPSTRLINMYGITETTVHVTFKEIRWKEIEAGISNIGGPIPTLRCYVLDEQGGLCGIGVPGELYVGGAGVARGYLNRDELTAQKFLWSPFQEGERLYRSGDKARWLQSGELEYLGRIDEQVKIRGYRIELGEIENVLQQCPLVSASVVMVKEDAQGDKSLIAYIVPEQTYHREAIQSWLNGRLPSYMIPSLMMELKELPLTSNGKIDRKALPDVDPGIAGEGYVAPRNELEQNLAVIWSEVLGHEQVGVKDSFFHIGGDSIKAIRVISKANQLQQGSVTIADLYARQTIAELAAHFSGNKEKEAGDQLLEQQQAVEALRHRVLNQMQETDGVEDIYPMSDIQKGMFFYSLKDQEQAIYHDQMVHQVTENDFDPERFRTAYRLMIRKHSILRTGFSFSEYEQPVQIVYSDVFANYKHYDLKELSREEQQSYLMEFLQKDREQPFGIARPSLSRLRTFHLGGDRYCYMFICHHSIIDGWSDASFNVELFAIYHRLEEDAIYVPAPLKSSYRDFVLEQLAEKNKAATVDWWKKELSGFKRLELPPVSRQETPVGHYYYRELGRDLMEELKAAARQSNSSVQALCFSAYVYVLSMLSYQKDFVVGLVTNNRRACEDGDKVLGCFLNTVPVRVQLPGGASWKEYVGYIQNKLLAVRRYGKLPLQDIVQHIGEKTSEQNPLFDTLFNYVDFHVYQQSELEDKNVSSQESLEVGGQVTANTQLNIQVNVTLGKALLLIDYSESLVSQGLAEKLGQYFETVLRRIITSPEQPARNEDILLPEERHQLLVEFNNTDADYPGDKTIVQLFEEQVQKTPDATVLVFEKGILTYRQLNEYANQLAHYLVKQYGIRCGELVAICQERSQELVMSILAVLKAGGAYVPIDPGYPQERISYMLEDSGSRILINKAEIQNFLREQDQYSVENLSTPGLSSHLAYVIYTSGSTGKPKGVMVRHRALANLCFWHNNNFSVNAEDRATLYAGVAFDASAWELFPYIICGASLYIVPEQVRLDVGKLSASYEANRITISFLPTQVGEQFIAAAEPSSLRCLLVGGDKLNSFTERKYAVINNYGPTENTVVSTSWKVTHQMQNIPIGKPIANTKVYILDEAMSLKPVGVPGEICIGGESLAQGYWNRPELTAEKFIANPFKQGERMYRTGDLGRWLEDGSIEFLGRIDEQVKVRGYRIELGEIESVLQAHSSVLSCVVVAKSNLQGEKELVAYVTAGEMLNAGELKAWLARTLPSYMVPSHFVQMDTLPLTPNGKVERRSLPDPDGAGRSVNEYVAPRNEIEEELTLIWQEVLGRDTIGINDNFFELGGHSLTLIRLMGKINKAFGGDRIKLVDLIRHPTIAELAELIGSDNKNAKHPAIITLRPGREEDVAFVIPGMPGLSDGYVELAQRIPVAGAVYGLQMRGLEEGEEPLSSIEEMAAYNIELVKTLEPKGRISLYAHSYGGTVAYEMARQLSHSDMELGSLVFVDSYPLAGITFDRHIVPTLLKAILPEDLDQGIAVRIGQVLQQPGAEWLVRISALLEDAGLYLPLFQRLWKICERSLSVHYTYEETLDCPATLVLAKAGSEDAQPDWSLWKKCFRRLEVLRSEGGHFSVVREPYCAVWVAALCSENNLQPVSVNQPFSQKNVY